jgi:hypothetical protein
VIGGGWRLRAAACGKLQSAVSDAVPRPNRSQTRQVDGDRCQCKFALKLGKDGQWHLSVSACVWTHNNPPHAPEVALHAQRRTLLSAEVLEKIQLSAQRGQKAKAILTWVKLEHPDLRLELTDVKNICTDFLRAGQLDAQQAASLRLVAGGAGERRHLLPGNGAPHRSPFLQDKRKTHPARCTVACVSQGGVTGHGLQAWGRAAPSHSGRHTPGYLSADVDVQEAV